MVVNFLAYVIGMPILAGLICLLIPERIRIAAKFLAFVTTLASFAAAIRIFICKPLYWPPVPNPAFIADNLSALVGLGVSFFSLLITVYSFGFIKKNINKYFGYILMTLGASLGAAFSNNLIFFLVFWGFLGVTLYLLISFGGSASAYAAKKTFIIVGGSDVVMILGVAILYKITGTFNMNAINVNISGNPLSAAAFLCLAIGAFAKAGAMPFHTWIPECSESAPGPVMAFLPASLDKLLGIYLLARISLDIFIIVPRSWVSLMLLIIGSITIIAAVMMALVQHNLKKLLAYHAVSQVGYMVLGIGTGNPIGIAGGLFHMVNHAIYKSCLFLSGSSVEKEAKTAELDELGGLARFMPITFMTCLVASLSISGVPPFNGFFSKWMIYQGLMEIGKAGDPSWIIWILVATFGSALTLASFMKLLYAVFFSNRDKSAGAYPKDLREVSISMWLPQVTLALLCVIFGIWAYQIPIRFLIAPCLKNGSGLSYIGIWDSPIAAALLAVGLLLGVLLFIMGRSRPARRTGLFVGGEKFEGVSGIKASSFYDTIKNMPLLHRIYSLAEKKVFDIYEEGSKAVFFFTDILRWLHNGILPTYMTWCLIGMLILFFMMRR